MLNLVPYTNTYYNEISLLTQPRWFVNRPYQAFWSYNPPKKLFVCMESAITSSHIFLEYLFPIKHATIEHVIVCGAMRNKALCSW